MSKKERIEIGNTAAQEIDRLYEAKYGRRLKYTSLSKDYKGSDRVETLPNGKSYNIDCKNNNDSYLFQYTRGIDGFGYAGPANPYPVKCETDKIFVYDIRKDEENFYEYFMDEYYGRYFSDISCVPHLKTLLKNLSEKECSEREYNRKVLVITACLEAWVKPDVMILRKDPDDDDCKLYLKIKDNDA